MEPPQPYRSLSEWDRLRGRKARDQEGKGKRYVLESPYMDKVARYISLPLAQTGVFIKSFLVLSKFSFECYFGILRIPPPQKKIISTKLFYFVFFFVFFKHRVVSRLSLSLSDIVWITLRALNTISVLQVFFFCFFVFYRKRQGSEPLKNIRFLYF